MAKHESYGLPLEAYVVTPEDCRRQAQSDAIQAYIEKMFEENPPPPLSPATRDKLRELLRPTPATSLVRWRVRLFCGHLDEMATNIDNTWPDGIGRMCWDCGSRQNVVAWEFLGRVEEPRPPAKRRPAKRRPAKGIKGVHVVNVELDEAQDYPPGRGAYNEAIAAGASQLDATIAAMAERSIIEETDGE